MKDQIEKRLKENYFAGKLVKMVSDEAARIGYLERCVENLSNDDRGIMFKFQGVLFDLLVKLEVDNVEQRKLLKELE